MDNANNYALAMYDVRGKQKFIYRSQHLKEIIGGSQIITDVFRDYLFPAAIAVRNESLTGDQRQTLEVEYNKGNQESEEKSDKEPQPISIDKLPAIYNYKKNDDCDSSEIEEFVFKNFQDRINGAQYIGEVVYDGGGNFLILYKDEQICRDVTAEFTRRLLTGTKDKPPVPTLQVICSYVTDIDENHFKGDPEKPEDIGDYERLYQQHRYTENQETPTAPWGTLPIVQVDYRTSMPYTDYFRTVENGGPEKVTKESWAKYTKYADIKGKKRKGTSIPDENVLDNMAYQKGEESLLAIIYIDGNNMGAQVQKHTEGQSKYNQCITSLRQFSEQIQGGFIDRRLERIDQVAGLYYAKRALDLGLSIEKKETDRKSRRVVVGSGDEITIITTARAALDIALAYLQALSSDPEFEGRSSCAGISVFHSHTPFADAYRIAEEACETGKQYMKRQASDAYRTADARKAWENACMIDYHFNQGVIGTSLEDIRNHEETTDYIIPWLVSGSTNSPTAESGDIDFYRDVNVMAEYLQLFNRSNTKGLLQAAVESNGALTMEVNRILAHIDISEKADPQGEKAALVNRAKKELFDDAGMITEKARGLMIRMIPVYDIWFNQDKWPDGVREIRELVSNQQTNKAKEAQ